MNSVEHYTKYFDAYRRATGDVLQACRSHDVAETLEYIADKALLGPQMRVLDCGSGHGLPARFFSTFYGCSVVGLNNCDTQLEHAIKLYSSNDCSFKKHDFNEANDFRDFDRVLFLESIGHADDLSVVFQNAADALTTGGIVYVKHSPARPGCDVTASEDFFAYKFFSADEIVEAATKAGLKVVEVSDFQLPDYSMQATVDFFQQAGVSWPDMLADNLDFKNFIFIK